LHRIALWGRWADKTAAVTSQSTGLAAAMNQQ
jgi:hypothetical protein